MNMNKHINEPLCGWILSTVYEKNILLTHELNTDNKFVISL